MTLAKTTRPIVRASVVRSRLHRWLDQGARRPVTWIGGPPGAGKTTLVAGFIAARKSACLWYQVDEGDADIATTFHYLGLAAPRRRRPLPHLAPEYRQQLSSFTRRFFRELFGRLRTPFILVLDNYQDLPSDAQFHHVLCEAVEELPAGGRVIVISRGDPPAAFARLRVGRLIGSLDSSELVFTAAEAGRLVRTLAPGRWPRDTLRTLYETSGGWAAGLVLLADRLRSERRSSPGVSPPSLQVLFDYFARHSFNDLDPETKDTLLNTAFLPSVTASMAETLTRHPSAGLVLADLHRRRYFIVKQAAKEPTFQYHPLFRAFLVSQASSLYSASRLTEMRRAAASLVEAAGQVEVAAGLLRDAADPAGLAGLIGRHAHTLLAQGRGESLETWLGGLSHAMFEENPWLFYWRGMCRFAREHTDCQDDLERAFTAFRERNDCAGLWASWAGLVMSYQAASHLPPTDRWIALFDELQRQHPFPSVEIETVATAAMLAAIATRQPGHPDGPRWAERAVNLTRRGPDAFLWAVTAYNWGLFHLELGDPDHAARFVPEMRTMMASRNVPPPAVLLAGLSVVQHEVAHAIPSYRETVSHLLEFAAARGIFHAGTYAIAGIGLMGALSNGDLDTASLWVRELEAGLRGGSLRLGPGYEGWKHAALTRAGLIRGDQAVAAEHRPEMLRLLLEAGAPFYVAAAFIVSAEVLGLRGNDREAREHVDRALEIAREMRSPYVEFMARLADAHLCFNTGKEAEGLAALRTGLDLGRTGRFVNSEVWHPHVMARLCARALEAGIEVEYVQQLVRVRRLTIETPIENVSWPWPVKVQTLGRFEVIRDGRPIPFARKVQRRPLALLKAVIAHGGREVREQLLMDALWPEADGDKARFALTTTIHRLRKLLGHQEAVVRKDGAISLDARTCWVDLWAVERLIERAETKIAESRKNVLAMNDAIRQVDQAAELFRGPFLGGHEDAQPAPQADRLGRRLIRQLLKIGAHWENAGEPHQASRCYEQGLRIDPGAEDVCRRLMKAYHALDRPSDAQSVYRSCREALARAGRTLTAETEAIARRLR